MNYIVGGAFNDTIEANGFNLVFGDHAYIVLNEEVPYKLQTAETTEPR